MQKFSPKLIYRSKHGSGTLIKNRPVSAYEEEVSDTAISRDMPRASKLCRNITGAGLLRCLRPLVCSFIS